MANWRTVGESRILDFDVETVAAGFADPEWVPQKITCVAWSWIGSDDVETRVCGPKGIFGRPEKRAAMLRPLVAAIRQADMVTGHNIRRFDLPIVNSECLRLGLDPLPRLLVQDTIRIVRTKGFKKGQDNLGRVLEVEERKLSLDWQAWQDAYDEPGWKTVRARAAQDVRQHKLIRAEMIGRGWLRDPVTWTP